MQPATATRVQHIIGAKKAFAFDINSVCSGSTYGIALADALIKSGNYNNILLIASEVYSRILNKKDFSTYPFFFGDGAGAIFFQFDKDASRGFCTLLPQNGRQPLRHHQCSGREEPCCPMKNNLLISGWLCSP